MSIIFDDKALIIGQGMVSQFNIETCPNHIRRYYIPRLIPKCNIAYSIHGKDTFFLTIAIMMFCSKERLHKCFFFLL